MTTPALTSMAELLARKLHQTDPIGSHPGSWGALDYIQQIRYIRLASRLMEAVGPALAEAWQDGRESVARDLMADRGEDGMIHATPNPYKEDPR